MGYDVGTYQHDFHVEPDKMSEALVAAQRVVAGEGDFKSLDAIAAHLGFEGVTPDNGAFDLGWYSGRWHDQIEDFLTALAPYATEGSYVRFDGEDNSLFGYRVVDGNLHEETAEVTWNLAV